MMTWWLSQSASLFGLLGFSAALCLQFLSTMGLGACLKPYIKHDVTAYALAWFCAPVVLGFFPLLVFTLGFQQNILLVPFIIMIFSMVVIFPTRYFKQLSHSEVLFRTKTRLWYLVAIVISINGIAAAVPQQLYDQLNYHLVVSKHLTREASLQNVLDYHAWMTGIYEYSLVWPRLIWDNDVFAWSFGQVHTYLIFIGTLLFSCLLIADRLTLTARQLALLALCSVLLLPYSLPESLIFRLFKPDALILTASFLALSHFVFADRFRSNCVLSSIVVLMLSLKLTAIHAALCLLPFALFLLYRLRRLHLCMIALAALPAILIGIKNYLLLQNPIFPALLDIFPSAFADPDIRQYWHSVSQIDQAKWYSGAIGLLHLLYEAKYLLIFCVVLTVAIKRLQLPTTIPLWSHWLFTFVFIALWPAFFGPDIYPRFVSSALVPLIIVTLFVMATAFRLHNRILSSLVVIAALFGSGLDLQFSRLLRWTFQQTLAEHLTTAVETYAVSQQLNAKLSKNALIVSDDPAKFLFDSKVVFFDPSAGVLERSLSEALKADPHATIIRHQIEAIITRPGSDLNSWMEASRICPTSTRVDTWKVYILADCV